MRIEQKRELCGRALRCAIVAAGLGLAGLPAPGQPQDGDPSRAPLAEFSLEVKLSGTKATRDGLGARVTVHAGGESWTTVHDGKSGYLSQSSGPLYFGLGSAPEVSRIEVLWPSGGRQTVEGPIAANSTREITEDASSPPAP